MSDPEELGLRISVEGAAGKRVGRIMLDRPKAMNALTYPGALAIDKAMIEWADDPTIALVLIEGAGEKAFCAGGDVATLYRTGIAGDFAYARGFWRDEYRLNARIKTYPKPYVAIMDGVTMGGGVGVSALGSCRVVTDRALLAMPEAAIGLLPDAGGLWSLSRAPGHFGEYLALTGARMNAGDAIHVGFADHYMPADRIDSAVAALIEAGSPDAMTPFYEPAPDAPLAALRADIDRIFGLPTALDIVAALEAEDAEWAQKALKAIRNASPQIVAGSLIAIRHAREMKTIQESLTLELRFNWRAIESGDFLEGVRALLIDKDRSPKWRAQRLEDLAPGEVEAMFETLGENDLTF